MNVRVKYEEQDEQKSFEAAKCYATQNTAEEIKETIIRETKDKSNTVYFRRFYVKNELKAEFW